MFTLSRKLIAGMCILLSAVLVPTVSTAAVAIDFFPTASSADRGEMTGVDVLVSGLDDLALARYQLDIGLADNALSFTDVAFGGQLGNPGQSTTDVFFDPLFPGFDIISVTETSLKADLGSQPDAFRLFTLNFTADMLGSSNLSFLGGVLNDTGGNDIEPQLGRESTINVVPIPGAAWLLVSALIAILGIRKSYR